MLISTRHRQMMAMGSTNRRLMELLLRASAGMSALMTIRHPYRRHEQHHHRRHTAITPALAPWLPLP